MNVVLGIDAIRYPLTGIGRYAFELAQGLGRHSEVASLRYFSGHRLCDVLPEGHMEESGVARAEATRSLRMLLLKSRFVVAAHQAINTRLQAGALRDVRDALYHGPNYYLPPHAGTCVATFHDLSIFRHPEFHPPERVRYMAQQLPLALQRASILLTDSAFTRAEVIAYSGLPAERVLAVPLAASSEFRPREAKECVAVLHRYGLNYQGYVLFAGTVEPRKNLARLLDAYADLPSTLRSQYPLVVVGYRGWRSDDLHTRLAAAENAGWVRYLGFVPEADLPVLFSGARSFAFPSIYEGFGLPVLEAMASGVPVVCSDASSLPEVAGGHALMCPPDDVDGLKCCIIKAVEDGAWRETASELGLEHSRSFSWERTVSETIQAYKIAVTL